MYRKPIQTDYDLEITPYVQNILDQPKAILSVLEHFQKSEIQGQVASQFKTGKYKRIVMTGLGASLNALYPAYLKLSNLDIPVLNINSAELIYNTFNQINSDTLLIIASQSGESAETLNLISKLTGDKKPADLLAITNQCESTLAKKADFSFDLHAGDEYSVATKTFCNTLVFSTLLAHQLVDGNTSDLIEDYQKASNVMEKFLKDWRIKVKELDVLVGDFEHSAIIGRGASMPAVWNGSLIQKEAVRVPIEAYHAAQFRHGPLEIVEEGFLLFALAGTTNSVELNNKLALDVMVHAGRIIWISDSKSKGLPSFLYPEVSDAAVPIFEILVFQLLSLVMAKRKKVIPGEFKNIGKVVYHE